MMADIVKCTWFMQYSWPMTVIVYRGTEFQAKVAERIQKDFDATKKVITPRKLQANLIVEHVH